MPGQGVGDHDASLGLDDDFDGPGRIRLICGQRDGNLACKQAVTKRPDRLSGRSNCHDLSVSSTDDTIADLSHDIGRVRHEDESSGPRFGIGALVPCTFCWNRSSPTASTSSMSSTSGSTFTATAKPEADVHARGVEAHLVVR